MFETTERKTTSAFDVQANMRWKRLRGKNKQKLHYIAIPPRTRVSRSRFLYFVFSLNYYSVSVYLGTPISPLGVLGKPILVFFFFCIIQQYTDVTSRGFTSAVGLVVVRKQ